MLFSFLWAVAIVVTLVGAWKTLMERGFSRSEYRVFVEERETEPLIQGPVVDTEPLWFSQHRIAAKMRTYEEVW